MINYFVRAAERIMIIRMDKLKRFVCQVIRSGSCQEDKRYGLDIYQRIGIYFVLVGVLSNIFLLSKVSDFNDIRYYEVSAVENARFLSIFIIIGFLYISGTARDVVKWCCVGDDRE